MTALHAGRPVDMAVLLGPASAWSPLFVVRWLGAPGYGVAAEPPAKMALNILRKRFARGEIDKEEFEKRERVLAD